MVTYVEGKLIAAGWRKSRGDETLWTLTGSEFTREEAIVEVLEAENRAADNHHTTTCPCCYSGRTAVVRMPWNGYHEVCDACGYTWHRAENELGDDASD